MSRRYSRPRLVGALALAAAALVAGCENSLAHAVGPKGSDAFARFVTIGTDLTAGVQSGGVLYQSQVEAWPALLAHQAMAAFTLPLLRSPGCTPPLIAPLGLGTRLSGARVGASDSSCAGALGTDTLPRNDVALPGATAFAALNMTPKIVTTPAAPFSGPDRARYPLVLGITQSQVTAMLLQFPTLVAVELGSSEVLNAATSGLVVPATSYAQTAPYTFVPATVFVPVYAAIADSVRRSRARAVLLSVPHVTNLFALRAAPELWADRAELAAMGVTVSSDCDGSANLVFTPSVVPPLVNQAAVAGTQSTVSCADVPGAADGVLTPADVAALNAAVDQMNRQIRQLADSSGWAFADVDAVYAQFVAGRAPYSAATEMQCALPYGAWMSLDGWHPNLAGQQLVANAVAQAIDAKYGFAIPTAAVAPPAIGPSGSLCH